MNFIKLIQEHYHSLTKSEKKVADYILVTKDKTKYSTIQEVKKATNVGDATIIRFCQKLGFSGFADLKIEIAKEDFTNTYETTEKKYYDQVLDGLYEALESTRQLLNEKELMKAVDAITKARYLYIFGVGSSGTSSISLEKMFLRVGVHCQAVIDPHYQAQSASLLDKQDAVVVFSLTGRTKDSYNAMNLASKNGATTIAITNYLSSPLAQLGDIVLQTSVEDFFDGGSLAGIISQLYISDLLVRGYERNNQVDTLQLREKVLRSIIEKRFDE
ncbi:MurR/RpiR family transcriptional regulator [Tetragenococcus solitarius]|uniref:MurR/RpiR family transcriptional regulator n=1 Tax=Tetragenococcus solitarius TaxID=71453 RepID=A0ABN3XZG5_9ENTE|nr:MurR/RpiR family transcriptional regulator [Tetragenococcus solitarius]